MTDGQTNLTESANHVIPDLDPTRMNTNLSNLNNNNNNNNDDDDLTNENSDNSSDNGTENNLNDVERYWRNSAENEELIMAHRRHSTMVVLLMLFLVKLWIDALTSHDSGLILFCVIMTMVGIRVSQRGREMEEELILRRRALLQQHRMNAGGDIEAMDPSLLAFSFQAQLAHAIAESQRMHMMAQQNGGIMPVESSSAGVDDAIRSRWKRWRFRKSKMYSAVLKTEDESSDQDNVYDEKHLRESGKTKNVKKMLRLKSSSSSNGEYGSVAKSDLEEGICSDDIDQIPISLAEDVKCDERNKDDNVCSICLCEYEEDDEMTKLPCDHIYHLECVTSWTNQSSRCPLCNHQLDGSE